VEELLEFVQCLRQHGLELLIGECLRRLTTLAHLLGAGTATLGAPSGVKTWASAPEVSLRALAML
jgi:hypothetical protein